ncbi:uncharacterized protein [Nicotiana tomentosiformis]|uniref:uncharacterized protein n=1 Tax=Nicotiana tomentosiformis TaxID=4098 RepID=UPI00388CCF1C
MSAHIVASQDQISNVAPTSSSQQGDSASSRFNKFLQLDPPVFTKPEQLHEPFSVSTPVVESIVAARVYRYCVVTVRGRDTMADFMELEMVEFDVIMGMDWLYSCFAKLYCRTRTIRLQFPNEPAIDWKGDDVVPMGRFISYLKATKFINKGCIYHLVRVTDTDTEAPTFEFVPVVNEFFEVFLDELPGILPDREIDLESM